MTTKPLPSVLAALGGRASAEPDAELLARFVAGDQPAFAELVRRYARLVWRVARTRCRSESAAEDVFQAAFVVLSRKAGSIRSGGALAGWLHRTAHRLAVRAARKERPAAPLPVDSHTSAAPLDALTARELLSAVDDEMARLSDGERAVLALCGIDGLTNDEAARRLGTSAGSVKGRLERARAKLRLRLDARGLTLPAVALGLIGGPTATTVQAALAIPLGGAVPPGIERLIAEGLGMGGTFTKATLLLALVAALVAVGGGDGTSRGRRATAAPVPKAAPPEKLVVWSVEQSADARQADLFGVWSPDGKAVVTSGGVTGGNPSTGVGELRVWDAATGKLTTTQRGDKPFARWAGSAAVSPDGKTVAVSGVGWTKRVYSLDLFDWGQEKPRASVVVNAAISAITFSPDGKTVVTLDLIGDLTARDLKTEKVLWTTALGQDVNWGLAYWNGGKELVTASEGGGVRRFDPATGKELPAVGKFNLTVNGWSVAADGKRVAFSGFAGKGPMILDVADGKAGERRDIGLEQAGRVALSPDGKHLAVGAGLAVQVFDAATGKPVAEAKGHVAAITDVRYSPDGKQLLTVGSDAIKVWTVSELMKPEDQRAKPDARRKNAPVPKATDKRVAWSTPVAFQPTATVDSTTAVWAPDGESVLVPAPAKSADGKWQPGGVEVRSVKTGAVTGRFVPDFADGGSFQAVAVAVSGDGKTVLAGGAVFDAAGKKQNGEKLLFWNWGAEKPARTADIGFPISWVGIAPDGRTLTVVEAENAVVQMDVATARPLSAYTVVKKQRQTAAYHPGGKYLLVAHDGGQVLAVETALGRQIGQLSHDAKMRAVAASPDGTKFAAGGAPARQKQSLVVVDETRSDFIGEGFRTFADAVPEKEQIHGLAFSPAGKHLAAACSDGVIRVFDVATGKLAAAAKDHAAEVFSVAYSPDGKRLLTVGKDAVKVWDVEEVMKGK